MQYNPLDIESLVYLKPKTQPQKAPPNLPQLVCINTISFQAMEPEQSVSEYFIILFGCIIGFYLFLMLLPIVNI